MISQKISKLITIVFQAIVVLTTACAPVAGGNPVVEITPFIPDTGSSVVTATPSGTQTPLMEVSTQFLAVTPTEVVGPAATVMVNKEGNIPFLTDERGRSLYAYLNDVQNSNASSCLDDCAVDWPPMTVSSAPVAGEGINSPLIGILKRDDGSTQATYNGWPLYYYGMDTIPGTTFGQSYKGFWFLISTAGELIQQ